MHNFLEHSFDVEKWVTQELGARVMSYGFGFDIS